MDKPQNKNNPITLAEYRAQFINEKISRYVLIRIRFQAELYKTKVSLGLASEEEQKTLEGLLNRLDEEELRLLELRKDINQSGNYLIN